MTHAFKSRITEPGDTDVTSTGSPKERDASASSTTDGASEYLLAPDRRWRTALVRSLSEEHDYQPHLEGVLPAGLEGSLFRNGPGLFERNGYRKRNLLDGDGMIQCFDFADGQVRYRNRFVRTEKFRAEETAGVYLHPTWTTPAPGGWFANLGNRIPSQAGVATVVRNDRLLALDEGAQKAFYEMDPNTLDTIGAMALPRGLERQGLKPHTKIDPQNGDWYLAATEYGRHMTIRWMAIDNSGAVKAEGKVVSPRMTYFHDFMVTERCVIFVLHAVSFSPFGMLAGVRSFADSLAWKPEQGNLVLVQNKAGGEPLLLEAPAAWMWHALNAYERDHLLVADFVGYDNPDHFLGQQPAFGAVSRSEEGTAAFPGQVRRYLIDPRARTLREEIVDASNHEFPMIDPRVALRECRYGYFSCGQTGDWVLDGVARLDMSNGKRTEFRFGPGHFVGEPVFAPKCVIEDDGWLLALVQSGETGNAFLAVFDAANLAAGPVAKLHLRHHVPISFHGYWEGRA